MKAIKNFLRDESGLETMEWALVAGLIALIAAAVYGTSGDFVTGLKDKLKKAVE